MKTRKLLGSGISIQIEKDAYISASDGAVFFLKEADLGIAGKVTLMQAIPWAAIKRLYKHFPNKFNP